ncbi:MAG: UDP-N-acetylmuramoyl-L-alanine--D-glutamate ligase [Ruminococcaceae bacterium]|nr:UDP-N-acetylmuramoyl-L-alanine--D-glutamate ligase [Oscillospiraceae bacterium]
MTLNEYIGALKGKRIAVVGIGVSNLPLIRLLAKSGCDVTACDKQSAQALGSVYDELSALGVRFCLGPAYIDRLDYDVVFRTPGLHPDKLKNAVRPDTLVTSEMEAFFALCPCRTVAITGSDGKTTTSTVIAKLLEAEGYTVHLGGNIGKPLLCEIPEFDSEDIAVLELSSFQLHSMRCRPDIAVITNLSPNHLDVHPSFEDYTDAKKNIFLSQTGECRLVLNHDNSYTRACADEAAAQVTWFSRVSVPENGYSFRDGAIYRGDERLVEAEKILLPGLHNIENYMAAFAATEGLVSAETCRKIAAEFGGVSHRIELIRTLRGVRYYNDSIASSPTRTLAGLRSFDSKLILIAGGHDKFVPFDELAREITLRVKALFLVGETAEKIRDAVLAVPEYDSASLPIRIFDDFRETVLAASAAAGEGDTVILSPACSSFDRFKNFAERGNTFRKIVEELK